MIVTPAVPAQVVPPPGSEVPIPPKPKTDTTSVDSIRVKTDTIKPPIGRAKDPRTADIGPQYTWNRDELFSSGALNVAELIERVPGATSFTTGGLNTAKFIGVNGDLNRVRVFYDGIEFDNLDAKTEPLLDLNSIQLWTLESVSVERAANELRVHLRTWQVDRTVPYTRVDVSTGDENTDIYRGFYGKRFGGGQVLQAGANQYGNTARYGGGGDALSIFARVGTAGKRWSVDAAGVTRSLTRTRQASFGSGPEIPSFEAAQRLLYLRGAYGNVADGPWAEAIFSTQRLKDKTPRAASDSTETTSRRNQYILTAGLARGPLRASVSDRVRAVSGDVFHSPAARLEFSQPFGIGGLFLESDGLTSTTRADAIFRLNPIAGVAVAGSLSKISPDSGAAMTALRLEAGMRIRKPWLSVGFITRDTASLPGLRYVDSAYIPTEAGKRSGLFVALRGPLYRQLGIDLVVTRWDSVDTFRPRFQVRSELSITTSWLSRFPSGNFGLHASVVYDYRGRTGFPTAAGPRLTGASSVFSGVLEIRILSGVASYRVTNMGYTAYQLVPDFYMPRTIQIYGLRWAFWN